MSLPDVRDSISGEVDSVLCNSLSRSLPGFYDDDPIGMSGMDCIIAVIRHICT